MAAPRRKTTSARRRRRLSGRLLVVGVVALAAFLYYRPLTSYLETRKTVDARQVEVARLEAERARLELRLRRSTSAAALQRKARCIGYVKPGERLFIVKGVPRGQRSCTAD